MYANIEDRSTKPASKNDKQVVDTGGVIIIFDDNGNPKEIRLGKGSQNNSDTKDEKKTETHMAPKGLLKDLNKVSFNYEFDSMNGLVEVTPLVSGRNINESSYKDIKRLILYAIGIDFSNDGKARFPVSQEDCNQYKGVEQTEILCASDKELENINLKELIYIANINHLINGLEGDACGLKIKDFTSLGIDPYKISLYADKDSNNTVPFSSLKRYSDLYLTPFYGQDSPSELYVSYENGKRVKLKAFNERKACKSDNQTYLPRLTSKVTKGDEGIFKCEISAQIGGGDEIGFNDTYFTNKKMIEKSFYEEVKPTKIVLNKKDAPSDRSKSYTDLKCNNSLTECSAKVIGAYASFEINATYDDKEMVSTVCEFKNDESLKMKEYTVEGSDCKFQFPEKENTSILYYKDDETTLLLKDEIFKYKGNIYAKQVNGSGSVLGTAFCEKNNEVQKNENSKNSKYKVSSKSTKNKCSITVLVDGKESNDAEIKINDSANMKCENNICKKKNSYKDGSVEYIVKFKNGLEKKEACLIGAKEKNKDEESSEDEGSFQRLTPAPLQEIKIPSGQPLSPPILLSL
ncbi:hypothetical protein [Halobacteriovorax sp. CON-3]|uniref:hypothetical protein n=1 Tax=Halobacteriovorax sp. CON-3 TaxID=3157710 RepID=UPI00371D6820